MRDGNLHPVQRKQEIEMASSDPLFLGLDSSTQSLKAMAIDAKLNVVYERIVNFDTDLPEFKTEGGAHHHDDGLTVTAPAMMWVAALDLLLEQMIGDGFEFGRVAAISGSGQQHGSVYLRNGAEEKLGKLQGGESLREQLKDAFSVGDSPIWMDSSTSTECANLEAAMGGAQAVAEATGSRAYERFTGNQIAKIAKLKSEAYEETERIALVSSFMASLLIGGYASIDASDGAGMNLMDLRTKEWVSAALDACAPGLGAKLGEVVPSHAVAGTVHQYYRDLCGLPTDCLVIAFSGDNPNSLAGLMLREAGEIAISLGTSDTVFGSLSDPTPSAAEGHIFGNPVDPDGYMAMICYKNGSLTREDVRDKFGGGTWESCAEAVARTPAGNNGMIGFYVKEPEITPTLMNTGVYRFDSDGNEISEFPVDADARAVLEGQFLSMRLHGAKVGLTPKSILATGGASRDASVIRIMADVLGVPVFTGDHPNSSSLGAAYRALHGWRCASEGKFVPYAEVVAAAPSAKAATQPDMAAHEVYTAMLPRYAELEQRLS